MNYHLERAGIEVPPRYFQPSVYANIWRNISELPTTHQHASSRHFVLLEIASIPGSRFSPRRPWAKSGQVHLCGVVWGVCDYCLYVRVLQNWWFHKALRCVPHQWCVAGIQRNASSWRSGWLRRRGGRQTGVSTECCRRVMTPWGGQ